MAEAYSPVIVFTFNRPDHTKNTLNALNKCDIANETDLYIFCDHYKKEKDKEAVEAVRRIVDDFEKDNSFKSVTVKKAKTNLGLATSIINGATEIIRLYRTAIVVEDDLIASKFFLRFMNDALHFYEKNERVWAISGYSFPMKSLEDYPHDIYFSGRGCSWGWATWYDRWNTVDWNVGKYKWFKHNWYQRWRFSRWGLDLPVLLDYQMCLNAHSWAVKWCFSAFKQNKMTVYPKRSYLKNCGIDGSGVHSQNTYSNKFDTFFDDSEEYKCNFEYLEVNKRIRKEFRKKYSNGLMDDIKEQAKAFLVRNKLWSIIKR